MPVDRLLDIFELMARRGAPISEAVTLCGVAAKYIGVTGAGIAIQPSGGHIATLCTSDGLAKELMEIEQTVGEGPCVQACSSERAVAASDLFGSPGPTWVTYAPLAHAAGARAVFGYPVRIGAIRLGALSLYTDQIGSLSEVQSSDAYLMSSVVGRAVLAMQGGSGSGAIVDELRREGTFDFTVHEAAGMVAAQGRIPVGDALVRLRAHAYATDTTASSLARRVLARHTVFDGASEEWREMRAS
jgi:hypothetical protein